MVEMIRVQKISDLPRDPAQLPYIYLIGTDDDYSKIGISKTPERRVRDIIRNGGRSPSQIAYAGPSRHAPTLERGILARFEEKRVAKSEWLRLPFEIVLAELATMEERMHEAEEVEGSGRPWRSDGLLGFKVPISISPADYKKLEDKAIAYEEALRMIIMRTTGAPDKCIAENLRTAMQALAKYNMPELYTSIDKRVASVEASVVVKKRQIKL